MEITAAMTKNLEQCSEITDSMMADDCVARIAFDSNDSSICSGVKEEVFRQDCINEINAKANTGE